MPLRGAFLAEMSAVWFRVPIQATSVPRQMPHSPEGTFPSGQTLNFVCCSIRGLRTLSSPARQQACHVSVPAPLATRTGVGLAEEVAPKLQGQQRQPQGV